MARPKQPAGAPAAKEEAQAPAAESGKPESASVPSPASASAKEELPTLDFSDSQFADSGDMSIEVETGEDPVQADIEQAAVLFANGQDSAARSVLEMCARSHTGAAAERLWRMLLDLVQVLGDRAAFEKLGMEFAQVCEKSPPTWRQPDAATPAAVAGEKTVAIQGVVTGADSAEILKLKTALGGKGPMRIDLGKLVSCDDDAANALGELLRLARKKGVALTVDGAEGLAGRLESRLVVGQPESAGSWLLLLELYQRLGQFEAFEEKAVDYAVTFEVSPPSWEDAKAVAKGKAPAAPSTPKEHALILSGELKNYRFGELPNYLDTTELPILDFSRVKRLDFFSAGLLRNTLEPYCRQGKEVVIRHPHHLVAELMGIVGLSHVARIIVPKF
ncbi:MAG TPA: STAS domain-containing protein [Rhodocyclaceae bacterium]|nr:STAS domain-containing protein [Rhodocyclaceae bacterium]